MWLLFDEGSWVIGGVGDMGVKRLLCVNRPSCRSIGPVSSVQMWGKGAAVATYTSPANAQKAVRMLNSTTIPGNERYIEVKLDERSSSGPSPGPVYISKKPPTPSAAGPARVFVRGFDFGTTDEELQAHCGSVGSVTQILWTTKGSAIVEYSSPAEAAAAIETLNGTTIPGNARFIDVKMDREQGNERGQYVDVKSEKLSPAHGKKRPTPFAAGPARVFVRGFDFGTTDEELQAHCGSVGSVTQILWTTKGSAIVEYSSPAEAAAAIETLNGTTIPGNARFIDVKMDREQGNERGQYVDVQSEKLSPAHGKKRPTPSAAGPARVFVRGFDFGTTDEELQAHCGSVGSVTQILWTTKGSAIVEYSSPAEAAAAIETLNGTTIPGNARFIDVKVDREQGNERGQYVDVQSEKLSPAHGKKRHAPSAAGPARVFVRGFDFGTTDEELQAHCGSVGSVTQILWTTKGSAIVEYSSPAEAAAAIETLNGTTIPGNARFIDVKMDREQGNERGQYVDVQSEKLSPAHGKKRPTPFAAGPARVFVRGFDFGTTDEELQAHCGSVGSVTQILWTTKGSAIVEYSSPAEAAAAIETLNGTTIPGNARFIDVKMDEEQTKRMRMSESMHSGKGTGDEGMWVWIPTKPVQAVQKIQSKGSTTQSKGSTGKSSGGKGKMEDQPGSGRVFVRGFDFGTSDEQLLT